MRVRDDQLELTPAVSVARGDYVLIAEGGRVVRVISSTIEHRHPMMLARIIVTPWDGTAATFPLVLPAHSHVWRVRPPQARRSAAGADNLPPMEIPPLPTAALGSASGLGMTKRRA